jgi:hypothetical protein
MTYAAEEAQSVIVAGKPTNKAGRPVVEWVD